MAYLSVKEAEQKYNFYKASTWRALIAKRAIPFVKIRRAVRIPEEAIQQLIRENTVPAIRKSGR